MRLANKNEVIVILGDKAMPFAQFCLSEPGAAFKFLFDNTTSFDLDEAFVQGMLATLLSVGVIDQACVDRFAMFTAPTVVPRQYIRTYRVPVPESENWVDYIPKYCSDNSEVSMLIGYAIVKTNGVCTAPGAEEI